MDLITRHIPPAPGRTWRVHSLSPENTVVLLIDGELVDSGDKPSEFGDWGMTRSERGILRRGMTRSGKDKRPRRA